MSRLLLIALALVLPLAATAQHVGVPLVSTSVNGVVSATYGYFRFISATSSNIVATDSTKVAKAGDTMTGNLGIGVSPAQNTLHLHNATSGGTLGIGQQNDSTPYMQIGMDSGWQQYIANNAYWTGSTYNYVNTGGYSGLASMMQQMSGLIRFLTASGGTNPISWSERMRIANNGNVGIGNDNPGYKLSVAGTIESTSGGIRFPDGTTQSTAFTGSATDSTKVAKAGDTMTGNLVSNPTAANFPADSSAATTFEVRSDSTRPATMTFHRVGAFAAYFGLGTDNHFRVGGWSMGGTSYKLWHEGNDGASSGLDADTLDGLSSANFVAKSGDTMTGNLHVAPAGMGTTTVNQGNSTNPGYVEFRTSDTTRRGYLGWANGSNITLTSENGWGQTFIAGGSERMRLTAAGLLGIGTGSPSYKFDVHDTATDTSGGRYHSSRFYKYFNPASASSAYQTNLWVQCDTAGAANNITGDHLCQYTTNGYSGTANLSGMYGTYVDISNGSTGTASTARAVQANVTNSAGGTITNANGAMAQVTNSAGGAITSAIGLQSQIINGGAGTITSAYGLVTSWWKPAGTITNGYGVYLNDVDASNGWGIYQLGANDGNYFAGKVGIGTAPTGYLLSVAGDIYANGGWLRTTGGAGWYSETYGGGWHMEDTTWIKAYNGKRIYTTNEIHGSAFYHVSDQSLKKNVATYTGGLSTIGKLRGVRFDWRKDGAASAGVIAQEVEKVVPTAVTTNADGKKAVDYDQLIAPMIEAIKELKAANDNLKAANDRLANENRALRDDVRQIKEALSLR